MEEIIKVLENLENLFYKILVWIVLIPKTLLQVVLHPDWASSYIHQELGEGKSRFDEYFSPIVLLLLVALLPFIAWNFLPVPGVEITSPSTDNPTRSRNVDFDGNIEFISTSTDGFITTYWRVEKEFFDGETYNYPVLQQNRYTNNPAEINSIEYFNYKQIDSHTIQDFYNVEFPEAGNYWVVVDASKFDRDGYQIEAYTSNIHIYVPPEDSEENVNVYARTKPDENKFSFNNIGDQLQNEKTIFMALGLLLPPLLFSLAIKLFGKDTLSEDNLKETFYVQCYYFAPIAFIYWATRYAAKFFTPDVFFRYDTDLKLIVLLPMILAVFWFISVQTREISKEGNISGGLALLVVLVCMFILGVGVSFVVFNDEPDLQDVTRKSSIWLYPLLAVGLLSTYHVLSILQRRKEKLTVPTGDKVLVGGIVFIIFITMCLVLGVLGQANPLASTDFDVTQQTYAAQAKDEYTTFEAEKFFTEEFDGNIDNWLPAFMPSGDLSQVEWHTENGRLSVQLSQLEDQIPQADFINSAFMYSDVEVETVATIHDSNPTSISLICRFNGNGWYEFEVSNAGVYKIYAYDNQSWSPLDSGESAAIKTDLSENKLAARCQGNELTLIINDTTVTTIQDTTFNFAEGAIGIAVFSPEGLPVTVDFGYVKVSEPPAKEQGSDTTAAVAQIAEEPTEAIPTATPLPEAQQFYTEEFDSNDYWTYFVVDGNTSRITDEDNRGLSIFTENSALTFDINDNNLWTYFTYDPFEYEDVRIDMRVTNRGVNTNNVSLICRYTDTGWYEFNIGNDGLYTILVAEVDSDDNVGYKTIFEGGSTAIKSGKGTNEYTAICNGNTLSLYINGKETRVVTETSYNLTSGKIGVSVSSFDALPVAIDVDWVVISEP